MLTEQVEKLAGVCPLLYRQNNPQRILIVKELKSKEATGKLAGMWGPGFETVEEGESHLDTIRRFFKEEIVIDRGQVFIPEDLEETKLCVVRISPPQMAARLHAYPLPVSPDFVAGRGHFVDEVDGPLWVDCGKVLSALGGINQIIFKAGTYEIVRSHLAHLSAGYQKQGVELILTPINLPDWYDWAIYRLLEQGFSQTEALSRLRIDPRPLIGSSALVRSLQ